MTDTPNRPPLSPVAQAVLDAFVDAACGSTYEMHHGIAAALRAAADHIEHSWDGAECVDHLQAIAAELEGSNA